MQQYWAMDTKVRAQARQQCRMFPRNNPATAELSVEAVFGHIHENVQSIMGQMSWNTANLPGSDGFWLKEQGRLENTTVDQLQSLMVFTTYSAAGHTGMTWLDSYRATKRISTPFLHLKSGLSG